MKGFGGVVMIYLCSILGGLSPLNAQYYLSMGFAHGFSNLPSLDGIVSTFNQQENHELGSLRGLNGYRAGIGQYSKHLMVELGYGNMTRRVKSTNPNQLKENAELVVNNASVHINFGYKPFEYQYLTFGLGMHLGLARIRYSFGGDYITPVNQYNIAPEIFVSYAIKLKFLLKRSQRKELFYLLRIHPYYQLHTFLNVTNVDTELNNPANPQEYTDNLSHFGIRVSFIVPFLPKDEKARRRYLDKPKKDKDKKKKKRKEPLDMYEGERF